MVTVDYEHAIAYGHDLDGKRYPRLTLSLINPANSEQAIDTDAYLDTGAERSVFDGTLAPLIGIDLLTGQEISFQPATGPGLEGRLHAVRLSHSSLGVFDIQVAFSMGPFARNLLGRDFFSLLQIGFRESNATLYVTVAP